ncbi:MAG TPA: methionine--tRNA ligase [Solirubrobacteraceae bacterium]|nr:methionine--tRNA ligase [Solirubrobacteraceae bacterium]
MAFYITTSISYVNGQPHLGHAYEAIATDIIARHHRQRGEETFFLTGTDEHGEPVADSARANGMEPRAWADLNAAKFQALLPVLDVAPDFFIRTTDPEHTRRVQAVLQRVYDNGYVHKGVYEGWYCPRCADFKVENEILEGNRCPIHEISLTREHEENYFFQLSAFQERLEAWFADHPDFVAPARAKNEAEAFLAGGLQDVSLSRAKLNWGVAVPWDPSHVFYVWFDALLNYYTAPGFARPGSDLTAMLWPADVHMIGKDILKFHTIFWPAMLMAAGLEPPRRVFVHGHLAAADGRKMSKSLGNGIDPMEVVQEFGGPDPLRFYLMRDVRYGSDGPVGRESLTARYNAELANDYGNLASRTLAMITRYRAGDVPAVGTDPELRADFDELEEQVAAALARIDISGALDLVWQRVRRLNRYVEERRPWELAREPTATGQLDSVLASLHEGVRVVSVLLWPYIPGSAQRVLAALGRPSLELTGFAATSAGVTVESIPPLFPTLAPV